MNRKCLFCCYWSHNHIVCARKFTITIDAVVSQVTELQHPRCSIKSICEHAYLVSVKNMAINCIYQSHNPSLFVIVAPPSDPNAPTPEGSTITTTAGEQLTVSIATNVSIVLFICCAHAAVMFAYKTLLYETIEKCKIMNVRIHLVLSSL